MLKLKQQININIMADTKVRELQSNADPLIKHDSGNEELIKRESIKDSPFEVITQNGVSFGVMGNYRLTEESKDANNVRDELAKITWNRIVQVIMVLEDFNKKNNNKIEDKV